MVDGEADAGRSRKGRAPWTAVAPAVFAAAWGGNHFTPLMLMYRQVDGYSVVTVDAVFGAYVAGLVPGFLLSGGLSDRYGRKKVMVPALLLGIAASLVLAVGAHDPVVMCAGRLLSGLSVAAAMVVGASWLRELSDPVWTPGVPDGAGARRASTTLTLGFGLGAGLSGALAQWAPEPDVVPYAVHAIVSVVALAVLAGAPETRRFDAGIRSPLADVRVPRASRLRFVTVLLPLAPWVFGTAALAYAVLPTLLGPTSGGHGVVVAALLAVVTLGVGAAVQTSTQRLPRALADRAMPVGMAAVTLGALLCARAVVAPSLVLALVAAAVLGVGYGLTMVTGLVEVQHLTDEEHLAGLTGVYYALAYSGFVLPVVLAWLEPGLGYHVLLVAVACVAGVCAVTVTVARRVVALPRWRDEEDEGWAVVVPAGEPAARGEAR